jgi:hypothetical protein
MTQSVAAERTRRNSSEEPEEEGRIMMSGEIKDKTRIHIYWPVHI